MGKRLTAFIGRKEELALIDQMVNEWDTLRIFCIYGPGGIGKTRLLQEVKQRYQRQKSVTIPDIIDFAYPSMMSSDAFGHTLARRLGEDIFKDYLQALDGYTRMSWAKVSRDRLEDQQQKIGTSFFEAYDQVASERRIVFLDDTLDDIRVIEMMVSGILQSAAFLKNTVMILSGRQTDKIYERLKHADFDAKLIDVRKLQPFAPHESNLYFEQTTVGREIDSETREKVRLLTDGRPVLIDLAIDWLEREMPLPELLDTPVKVLKSLAEPTSEMFHTLDTSIHSQVEQKWQEFRHEFEAGLVRRILRFDDLADRIILNMAHVSHYFDAAILSHLTGLSREESEVALQELGTRTFVKSKPNNVYVLHDEMSRLVNRYVWPAIDAVGTERQKLDRLMVTYYEGQLHGLETRLQDIRTKLVEAENNQQPGEASQWLHAISEMETQRSQVIAELLFHTLRAES